MIDVSHKATQYGWFALKVFFLLASFYFVYLKLSASEWLDPHILQNLVQPQPILFVFFLLAALNWLAEIAKWQTACLPVRKLTFREAAQQSLAALALSLATPNRIGEYGAKAYFFEKKLRKKILLFTFLGHKAQLFITLLFGLTAIFILIPRYGIRLSWPMITVTVIALGISTFFLYKFRNWKWNKGGLSLKKIGRYVFHLPISLPLSLLGLSLVRYLCFSVLFWLLLGYFGAPVNFAVAYPLVCAMYLMASIVPTLFWLDVVIRGGVAVWLFSLVGVPELPVLATVLAMWVLNMVAPALIGSFFVFTYRPAHL
ncbi:MAG: hypothetical protein CMC08_03260 [Flavobacteriaceae bacterium]|nr:hypothetical protein [Flavobacteriaceae bacterium]